MTTLSRAIPNVQANITVDGVKYTVHFVCRKKEDKISLLEVSYFEKITKDSPGQIKLPLNVT